MVSKKFSWDRALIHPFCFAIYPVLSLWATNASQTPFYATARAAFIALIFLVITLLASLLIFRDRVKSAVFTSLFMLLFLTYGHLFSLLDMRSVLGFVVGRHRFLIPIWASLLASGSFFLWRSKSAPYALNRTLNLISLFLVALVTGQILFFEFLNHNRLPQFSPAAQSKVEQKQVNPVDGPDVYYILLDGYSRADVLKKLGGPEVNSFLDELEKLGFSVMGCAQGNYDRTNISMAATLNMNYLDELDVEYSRDDQSLNSSRYEQLLKHSLVRKRFEEMGYSIVTFKAVYNWINISDSDYFIDSEEAIPFYNRLEVVNFQYLFLSTTLMRPLLEAQIATPKAFERLPVFILQLLYPKADLFSTREYKQYQQNLYALEKLSEAPGLPGKKFVYAHLFITHQPYVFNPDGSFRWPPKDDDKAYFAQIEYVNKRIPEVLKKIIKNSKTPPIIVLQSDHGYPNTPDRVRILNSYYLPNGGTESLYPEITPVNTFRSIFNHYFARDYPLLQDQSFHSPADFPYRFEQVPPTCTEPQQ